MVTEEVFGYLSQYDSVILILLIIGITSAKSVLPGLPLTKEVFYIYSGWKFGLLVGGITNFLAMMLGAILAYEAGRGGRLGLKDKISKEKQQKYQQWIENKGLRALILCRSFQLPLVPNDTMSIVMGFSRLDRYSYLIINIISYLLYGFFFSYLGANQLDNLIGYFDKIGILPF